VTTHDQHTNRLSTEDLLTASPDSTDRNATDRNAELAPDEEFAPDGGVTRDGDVAAGRTGETGGLTEPAEDEVTTGRPSTTPTDPATDTDRSTDADRSTDIDRSTDTDRSGDTDRSTDTGSTVSGTGSPTDDDAGAPLFAQGEVEEFRIQWRELQAAFVDSPQEAVRDADELVAEIMQNLAATFADHKRTLEDQWSRGDEVQTEDLRLALRRYRSFFNQLLSV
jgi:hypothetical protein